MLAEILNIGTELIIGQVVNTNATYLAKELAKSGIDLHFVTAVGDNPARMLEALRTAWNRSDLVICSGGLGPTADDLTHEMVARFFEVPLVLDEAVLTRIEGMFAARGRKMLEAERKLAMFPDGATLIANPAGTAAGVWVERNGKHLMTFPGVPHELETMWESFAAPKLGAMVQGAIVSRLLKFVGISEADVAEKVKDLLEGANPTVAPYAGNAEVHLRVTAKAPTLEDANRMLLPVVTEIERRLEAWQFGSDDETLPAVIGKLLREQNATLAMAESVTGGLISSRITDIAGASDYFLGGLVTYAVSEKVRFLGLDPEFIARHTHVSAEVSVAMAEAVKRLTDATWTVGITGYAGGSSNTPELEVGRVFVAVSGPDGTQVESFNFGRHPREKVKWFASQRALGMLFQHLRRQPPS